MTDAKGGSKTQAYGADFAVAYNRYWGEFSTRFAPAFEAFLKERLVGHKPKESVLVDLCCGTGQFAAAMLASGYHVVGIDLSPHMLRYAIERNRSYLRQGRAQFLEQDAAAFSTDMPADVVVSLYDSLNHLADIEELTKVFVLAFRSTKERGLLCFDLNTAKGLETWNGISVEETSESCIIRRGVFEPGQSRAYARISGFLRTEGALFKQFSQLVYNTVFSMVAVDRELHASGWNKVEFHAFPDIDKFSSEPESLNRVFVVAVK